MLSLETPPGTVDPPRAWSSDAAPLGDEVRYIAKSGGYGKTYPSPTLSCVSVSLERYFVSTLPGPEQDDTSTYRVGAEIRFPFMSSSRVDSELSFEGVAGPRLHYEKDNGKLADVNKDDLLKVMG